jgi:hypothetical protein
MRDGREDRALRCYACPNRWRLLHSSTFGNFERLDSMNLLHFDESQIEGSFGANQR